MQRRNYFYFLPVEKKTKTFIRYNGLLVFAFAVVHRQSMYAVITVICDITYLTASTSMLL